MAVSGEEKSYYDQQGAVRWFGGFSMFYFWAQVM